MGFLLADVTGTRLKETARSAEAFAGYVALGPGRSLRALAEQYIREGRYKSTESALRVLKKWSAEHRWQDRLAESITRLVERNLELAAELDADTFLKTSLIMNSTIDAAMSQKILIDPIESIKIRETVRRPQAKGATSINVKLDIQLSEAIQRVAEAEGMNAIEREEFERDVQKHLAEVGK